MPEPTPFDDGQLYDLLLSELDYGFEFYVGLAKQAAGPVLDIACGTGRILLPCLEAGIDIEGLDLYAPMLEQLQHKAAQKGLALRLHQDGNGVTTETRRLSAVGNLRRLCSPAAGTRNRCDDRLRLERHRLTASRRRSRIERPRLAVKQISLELDQ